MNTPLLKPFNLIFRGFTFGLILCAVLFQSSGVISLILTTSTYEYVDYEVEDERLEQEQEDELTQKEPQLLSNLNDAFLNYGFSSRLIWSLIPFDYRNIKSDIPFPPPDIA